jgi:hypothetical protein
LKTVCLTTLTLFAIAAFSGCSSSNGDGRVTEGRVEESMRDYVAGLPPAESETDLAGAVKGAHCDESSMTYSGANVWICLVEHESGTLAEWCGAFVDGKFVPDREAPMMPCAAGERQ